MKMKKMRYIAASLMAAFLIIIGVYLFISDEDADGASDTSIEEQVDRRSAIPEGAVKAHPETDANPPVLHSEMWEEPVSLSSAINTAGAENSPFITPDGERLYFFFTPDPGVPAEEQILDGVTGIYYSTLTSEGWGRARRLILTRGGLALDGCPFVRGDEIWFCSARQGNFRLVDFWVATLRDGEAEDIGNAGERLNSEIRVGELHITAEGDEIYFHADLPGSRGGLDIWVTRFEGGDWLEPVNVVAVNTEENEVLPFITENGDELWLTRNHMGAPAIFRSVRTGGGWSEPELIVSSFAAEPALDSGGNLYFAHYFIETGEVVESDIYVAYAKENVEPVN